MPSRLPTDVVAPDVVAAAPVVPATSPKNFELPSLDLNFGSLTEGTDIPPPAPSPVHSLAPEVPTPPKTPHHDTDGDGDGDASIQDQDSMEEATTATTATTSPDAATAATGIKRPADDTPLSPALSNRQGSIRRLFSRGMLNGSDVHATGSTAGNHPASRPSSQGGSGSVADEKKSKRSSGWFRRLRVVDANAGRRTNTVADEVVMEEKQSPGLPPPMIPEIASLKRVKKEEASWGSDMFKDIK